MQVRDAICLSHYFLHDGPVRKPIKPLIEPLGKHKRVFPLWTICEPCGLNFRGLVRRLALPLAPHKRYRLWYGATAR